jgi:hypothetical protein
MVRPRKHQFSSLPAYSGDRGRLENLPYICWFTLFRLIADTCLYYISP